MSAYLFGQYLLEEGLIDADQLYEALQHQQSSNRALGEIACEEGMLTQGQVDQILEWQLCEDRDFGEAAVEMGILSQEDLDKLLEIQQEKHIYLGDALVQIGALEQDLLLRELERYDSGREEVEVPREHVGEEEAEDTPLAVYSILTRVLPRFTHGTVLSGGFYPTITPPKAGNIYAQRVRGDMEFELALRVPENLDNLIGGQRSGKGTAEFLTSVLDVFCSAIEETGKAVAPVGKAARLSEDELRKRKEKAGRSSCVEFFLIQPPSPDGEFHQINSCLLLGRGA